MSAMSNYLENEILDHILGTGSWTMPTNVYLALFTADPGEAVASPSGEVVSSGYARQACAFGAAASGVASNSAIETFGPATFDWGTITHWALYDAVVDGNRLLYGALTSSRVISAGDSLVFAAAALAITAA